VLLIGSVRIVVATIQALPLVLLHGLRSTPREFGLIALTLRSRGIHLITPSVDGYSQEESFRRTSWHQWATAASTAIARALPHGQPFVLGGLCSGGLLAAALTLDGRHGVAGLAMLSPTFDYDGWGQTRWRHLRKAGYALGLARWISIPEREPFGVKNPKIRAWVAREMRERASSASGPSTLPLWAVREVDRLKDWVRAGLPRLDTRTLVMHAREDDVCTLASAQRAMTIIGAASKRLVVLDDSYHMITIDNDRQRVVEELIAFSTAHSVAHEPEALCPTL
jgi:carboxylesterase